MHVVCGACPAQLRQKLYKHDRCPLLEPIATWERYRANNYSIIFLMSCELHVALEAYS